MNTLDEELRRADPALRLRHDEAAEIIATAVHNFPPQTARKSLWWKDWRVTLPVGVVGVLSLTGAAIAVPLLLGDENGWVDIDARIPITYVTDSGVSVSCVAGVYVRSESGRTAEDELIAELLANGDWTDAGQEIYDYAVANPRLPQEGEEWTNDSPEVRDMISFQLAFSTVIRASLPGDFQGVLASTDTCTGPFR